MRVRLNLLVFVQVFVQYRAAVFHLLNQTLLSILVVSYNPIETV